MSQRPISLSPDLQRLRAEGYLIAIAGGCLVVRDVPYVDSQRRIRRGTLISSLTLAGDVTQTPDTHIVYFDGDGPCDSVGQPLVKVINSSGSFEVGGLKASHLFSSKPEGGYRDYYLKMSTYATLLAGHAAVLQPEITAKGTRAPEPDDESVFHYTETASGRAGISTLTAKLENEKIAIIGLGGTGSYILDCVAKTPVREIHLFDADDFLQHNAFRAPGAPTLTELQQIPKKVDYFHGIYSRMHRGIVPHAVRLTAQNLHLLEGSTFAFLSMDSGEEKRHVVEKLEALNLSFIDVGMGLELTDGSLGGILRVTASTSAQRDHFRKRVSFGEANGENIYASNIQVADLNALNAVLAVIKWKKLRGFYRDFEREHHCSYTTDGNLLLNAEEIGC